MIKAQKLKDFDPRKFRAGYMSIKRNGIHGIFDPKEDFYSRTPKKIQGLERLSNALKAVSYPLVGELTIPEEDFETTSGLIRSSNSTPNAVFNIFNIIIPGMRFSDRYDILDNHYRQYFLGFENIRIEPMIYVENLQMFDRFYRQAISANEEGVCWIAVDHIYQPGKRNWDWMKRVAEQSIEARIIDILPGTVEKAYEHSMGHMLCEFEAPDRSIQRVNVGIFKDQNNEWRQNIYDNREQFIGEHVTIEFKNYSKYGIPTQPRFKAFRWDL